MDSPRSATGSVAACTRDSAAAAWCHRQDLYSVSGPAFSASPAAAFPRPITRRGLEEAWQAQRHALQEATQAGTLKDKGKRPDHLRRHIVLGLASAQTLFGQKTTVHHSRGGGILEAPRRDTEGGQVALCMRRERRAHTQAHLPAPVPVAFAALGARRTFPEL